MGKAGIGGQGRMPKSRAWVELSAAVGVVGFAVPVAFPVTAEATMNGCYADYGCSFYNVTHNFKDMIPSSEGGGGTTLSITLTAGTSVTATIGGSLTTSESVFFASAQEQINASIAKQMSASTTYGFTWTVPTSWSVGYLHAGADRDSTSWEYGHYTSTCAYKVDSSGSAQLPYHVPASWHNKQSTGGSNVN